MQLNFLGIAFFLLLLPGLVCAVIVSRLTTHRERKSSEYVIPSLIYGFIVFVAYRWIATALSAIGVSLPEFNLIPRPEQASGLALSPMGISIAMLLGLGLSFCAAACINHKVLHKAARALGVTRKFADRDVWSYMMTSSATDGWIVFRDHNKNLAYVGKIAAFSDEEDTREIVLEQTFVIDNTTGEKRFQAGVVYLAFPREAASFEIPPGEEGEDNG